MPDPSLRLIPVIVAGIVYMIIGIIWYSPYVLGRVWKRFMKNEKQVYEISGTRIGLIYVFNTIASLLFAYVLAHIIKFAGLRTFIDGANAGFWIWLGFVVTTVLPVYLYESRSVVLYIIYITYQLVAIVVIGGIIAVIQ